MENTKKSNYKSLSTKDLIKKLGVMIHDGLENSPLFANLMEEGEARLKMAA